MKLNDALENYYTFSASLSNVNRQLCFAGIAVVWVFVIKGNNGIHSLPKLLMNPLGFFVLGLILDLFHYIVASAIWGIYHRKKEKEGISLGHDFKAPKYINWVPLGLFWLKVVATSIGYICLLKVFVY